MKRSRTVRILRAAIVLGVVFGVFAVCTGGGFALVFGVAAHDILPLSDTFGLIARAGLLLVAGGVLGALLLSLIGSRNEHGVIEKQHLRLVSQITFVAVVFTFFYSLGPLGFGRTSLVVFAVSMFVAAVSGGQMYGDIVYAMLADRVDANPPETPPTTEDVTLLSEQMDPADPSHGAARMPEPTGRSGSRSTGDIG